MTHRLRGCVRSTPARGAVRHGRPARVRAGRRDVHDRRHGHRLHRAASCPAPTSSSRACTTGTVFTAVSGPNGAFTIPAMPPGTYTVTVTLMGFKTAVLNDVIANVAQPANVKAVLELGELEETVVVTGRDRDHPDADDVGRRDAERQADREPAGRGPRRVRPGELHARRRDARPAASATARSTACRRARSTSRSTA